MTIEKHVTSKAIDVIWMQEKCLYIIYIILDIFYKGFVN